MTIPFYFQFRTPVAGRGFAAEVRVRGRITCVEEYGATCIYGVNPGGLAAGGDGVNAAYLDFRSGLSGRLSDLAADADDLDDFRQAAQAFIRTTDHESVAEWEEARSETRAGATPAECQEARRGTDHLPVEITVERREPSRVN